MKTRLARTSESLIRIRSSLTIGPPAATSRRAWRSRSRSMALRMLLALANRGRLNARVGGLTHEEVTARKAGDRS